MVATFNDLSPDKQWDVQRNQSIRGIIEDWFTLVIVAGVAIALRTNSIPSFIAITPSPTSATATATESPGYGLFTQNLIDESPPNSYDFTMFDKATDSENVSVPSPCDGKISEVRADDPGGYGRYAEVACENGKYWFFAHLDSVEVETEQVIQKGESIGIQGTSGNSTGVHVHLEIASTSGGTAIAREQSEPMVMEYLEWLEG